MTEAAQSVNSTCECMIPSHHRQYCSTTVLQYCIEKLLSCPAVAKAGMMPGCSLAYSYINHSAFHLLLQRLQEAQDMAGFLAKLEHAPHMTALA